MEEKKLNWFAKVYNEFMFFEGLPYKTKMFFLFLKCFADIKTGECFPSYDLLQRITGWSRASISKEISNLEKIGLLQRKQEHTDGRYSKNVYKLNNELHWVIRQKHRLSKEKEIDKDRKD